MAWLLAACLSAEEVDRLDAMTKLREAKISQLLVQQGSVMVRPNKRTKIDALELEGHDAHSRIPYDRMAKWYSNIIAIPLYEYVIFII